MRKSEELGRPFDSRSRCEANDAAPHVPDLSVADRTRLGARLWLEFIGIYFLANALLVYGSVDFRSGLFDLFSVLITFTLAGPPFLLAVLLTLAFIYRLPWYLWLASFGIVGMFGYVNYELLWLASAAV